jgi:steroid delta-isomerase-like uncharacterized protein
MHDAYYMSVRQVEEGNIRIARQAIEAFNTGDTSRVHEFIAQDYFNHESQASPERAKLRGPDEVIDTIRKLRSAFADLRYEEQEIIASKDKVVIVLMVSGKHVGDFFGIPPAGRSFSYPAVHMYRISNGKIVEHRAIRDDLRFMMQLGVVGPASPQYEQIFQAWKGFMR